MSNPKSTASIGGHPIHSMLVLFPVSFFIAALVCDLTYLKSASPMWFMASEFLLGAGLILAVLAALAGLTDFVSERRIRNLGIAWLHAGGNIIVVLIEAYSLYIRYTTGPAVMDSGLILSVISVVILLGTGWLGSEMVFRYGVGVADIPADRIPSKRPDVTEDDHFPYPRDRGTHTEHRPH